MTAQQQHEITEIINMFLDLKPVSEIAVKLLPRHLSYIIKQFQKTVLLDDFIQAFPGKLAKKVEELMERQRRFFMDDIGGFDNGKQKASPRNERRHYTRYL
jgi:hypothetical protein